MGTFEKFVVNTKDALNVVGQKASKMVDVSKLKIIAVETENELSKKFERLGKLIYELNKGDESKRLLVHDCTQEIDDLYAKITDIELQIAVMKNKTKCEKCGFENSDNSLYCNKCGAELTKISDDEDNINANKAPTTEAIAQTKKPRRSSKQD